MLRQRVITAILLGVGLLVVLLWLPPAVAIGVFALIVLIGAREWSAFPGFRFSGARFA